MYAGRGFIPASGKAEHNMQSRFPGLQGNILLPSEKRFRIRSIWFIQEFLEMLPEEICK